MKKSYLAGKKNLRRRAYFWLLVNTVCWGAALIIVKPALEVASPFRYLLYRYALAIPLSLPILAFQLRELKWRQLKHVITTVTWLELLGTTLSLGLLYAGLQRTTALDASLLTTTQPLLVTVGGIWLLKERQEKHEWVGLLVAVVGAFLLVLDPQFNAGGTWKLFNHVGNWLIIGSLVVNLVYFPMAKKYYAKWSKWLVTTLSFYLGFLTFLGLSWWESGSLATLASQVGQDLLHPSVWVASGYMALFGSIIGLTAYIKGQDGIEASEASWFWYLQPAVYIPLAWWLLGDKLSLWQTAGLALVLIGVIWAERRTKKLRSKH